MRALMYQGPKQLEVVDVPKPTPKAGEVLLKIRSCGICGSDVHGYLGMTGRRIPPMVMGHEFSAEVEALGENTSGTYKLGDRVTVQPIDFCGHCEKCKEGYTNVCENRELFGVMDVNGAFEEYLVVPEKLLYKLPDNLSYADGAMIEPLAVAYCGVKKAGDIVGKNVLVVGGGTIGQLVLMVVKAMGPKKVILSDLSDARLETAKKLGADAVINPGGKDFVQEVKNIMGEEQIDIAIEAVGVGATVAQAMSVLKSQGTCVWVGNSAKTIEIDMQAVVTKELKIIGTYTYTHDEFKEAMDFIAAQNLDFSPLISKEISLEEAPKYFEALVTETDKYLKILVAFA